MNAASRLRTAARDESGSTLPLVIGFGMLALALVLVVAAVTSLYLERTRLLDLADGAALAAAEAYDPSALAADADGELSPALADDAVAAAAADYLADAEHGLHELRLVEADTPDGQSARVRLAAVWHAPISNGWIRLTVPLEVESEARSILH